MKRIVICRIVSVRTLANNNDRMNSSINRLTRAAIDNTTFSEWRARAMSAIFKLTIECVGGRYLNAPYHFVMEAPVELALGGLASYILDTIDFEGGDHLDEFYLANNNRGGKTFLTPDGEWSGDDDTHVMEMPLSAVFPTPKNKKLYYLYDFGASWCFQISKQGKQKDALVSTEYPRLVSEHGVKPQEYGDDDM
ncbi:MAG: hypothetical protein V4462_14995 [Pseudomonadota bacterium]